MSSGSPSSSSPGSTLGLGVNFSDRLAAIAARADELRHLMAEGGLTGEAFTKAAREYAEVEPVAAVVAEWRAFRQEYAEAEAMLADADPELRRLAEAEIQRLKARLPEVEAELRRALMPKDAADARSAILEVRAGTGGDEAALFAADLFEMYSRYAAHRGWRFEVLELAESDLGGLREGVALIAGTGVFARLKFESGVHRVQRVPVTEASGRIHTSAATVAVLPEAEEVDVKVDDKDLRIDVYRAGGAGGQHVNKTESAVRITHLPTGIVVAIQDEKSQHKNKAKAMKILLSRLYDRERGAAHEARADARRAQVGSGDRSERIRTYNFPQNRVTDHRIDFSMHDLTGLMAGTALDTILDALVAEDEAARLAELG